MSPNSLHFLARCTLALSLALGAIGCTPRGSQGATDAASPDPSPDAGLQLLSISAAKTLSAPRIDGVPDEPVWKVQHDLLRPIVGTSDNTAAFGVLWDDQYLYVAATILDHNLVNDSTDTWADDAFEIYLDPDHSHSPVYDAHDRHYIKGYGDAALLALQDGTGVLHATAPAVGGFSIELAIPWSNLAVTPLADTVLGFDLQQDDDDTGGSIQNATGWNDTTGQNYHSTAGFGHLELSSQTVGGDSFDGGSDGGPTGGGGGGGGPTGGGGGGAVGPEIWRQVPLRTRAQKTAGLSGGEGMQIIFDIDYAPSNPNIVYMVTDTAQVRKSTDGGASWVLRKDGFRAMGGSSLAISPYDENLLFVSGGPMESINPRLAEQGIYRSTNGGGQWTRVRSHLTVRENLTNGGDLLDFAGRRTVYAGTADEGLLRSTDGGTTWTQLATPTRLGSPTLRVMDVRVADRANPDGFPQTVYVSTNDSTHPISKLLDNGATQTITTVGVGLPTFPSALAIDPKAPSIIYAALRNFGVYKSTNGGDTFSAANSGLSAALGANPGKLVKYVKVSPVDSSYVFAGFDKNAFFSSHDSGLTWQAPSSWDEQNADGWVCGSLRGWGIQSAGDYFNSTPAPHPTNRDILLMTGEMSVITKSTDGGSTFRYSNTGNCGARAGLDPSNAHKNSLTWQSPDRFAILNMDVGVFLTDDGGDTFRNLRAPPFRGNWAASAGALDPVAGSHLMVVATGDNDFQKLYVSRNINAMVPDWVPLGGPDIQYQFIAFHPTRTNIVYAGYSRFTNIQLNNDFVAMQESVAAIFPGNGDILYATRPVMIGTTLATRFLKSTDGGSSWLAPYPDLPVERRTVGQISIDPVNADKLYVAALYRGVYILENKVWTLRNEANGLVRDWLTSPFTKFVAIDPMRPLILYAGSRPSSDFGQGNGVFRSTDGGGTWTNITANLGPELTPWGLTVSPYDGTVYVATSQGTWKRSR